MMESQPGKSMEQVIQEDGRYPLDAFAFLHDGLAKAVQGVYGDQAATEGQHHVSGQQLCNALRELALERWGMLAQTVLNRWNIRATIDFGNMVYLLIEGNFMRKTDEDSVEDFRDVYDFDQAFSDYQAFELKE
jgi:uncharacterized repeat protein (TIGR04138 family)